MSRDFDRNEIGMRSRTSTKTIVHNNIQHQASSSLNVDKKNSSVRVQPFATGTDTLKNRARVVSKTCQRQEKRLCDSANFISKKSLNEKHGLCQLQTSNEKLPAKQIDNNYGLDKISCHEKHRYERTHYDRSSSESLAAEKLFEMCDRQKRHSAKATCNDYDRQTSETHSVIGKSALRDGQGTTCKLKLRLKTCDIDQLDQREKTNQRHCDVELGRYTTNVVDLRDKEIAELCLENQINAVKVVQLRDIAKEKDHEIETMRMAHLKTLDKLQEIVERKGNEIENMRLDSQQNADNVRAIVEEKDIKIKKKRQDQETNAAMVDKLRAIVNEQDNEIENMRLDHQKNADIVNKLRETVEEKDIKIEKMRLHHQKNADMVDKTRASLKEKDIEIENMRLDHQKNADMVDKLRETVEEKDIKIEKMRLHHQKNADMVDKTRASLKEKDIEIEKMRLDHKKNADKVEHFHATVKGKDNDMENMRLDHQRNADMVAELRATVEDKDIEIEKMRLDHQENSRKYNEILNLVKEKEDKIVKMQRMNERAVRECQESERRSKEITKEMAKRMKTNGQFENCDDKMANTQLADRFQGLYFKEWVKLCKWLSRTFHTSSEIKIIETLSKLIRMSYLECLKLAQNQLKEFLLLQETEEEPLQNEHEDLFNLRKQYAHTEQMRLYVRKVVSAKTVTMETISAFLFGETGQSAREKIKTFLHEFIDCCWLMIVSKPAMSLNFDVIGKQYGDISEHFTIYSTKKPIEDETKEEGTVYEVVWPCVCMKDGSAYYKKGDVILVKRGKQYSANQRKCEAATNT